MAIGRERSYAPVLMAASDPAPALTRHALIPISLVVCFALVYWLRVGPIWIVAVALPALLLYVWAPALGARSLARFDRAVVQRLVAGRADELPGCYARALTMRALAAPAAVAERRGLVFAEAGQPQRARAAFRAAFDAYPEGRAPVAVRLGLAHASYAMGDDHTSIQIYREILRTEGSYPRLARHLAHSLARRGEDLKHAEELAEETLRESADAEAKLIRALVHAKRGQRGPARKLLKATREASGGDASSARAQLDQLREDVEVALEEL